METKSYNERKNKAEEFIQHDNYADALIEYNALFRENRKDLEVLEKIKFLWARITSGNYDFVPVTPEHYTMRGVAKFYHNELENS